MSIPVTCPHCATSYVVPANFTASKGECPTCGAMLSIGELPGAQPTSPPQSPAQRPVGAAAQPDPSLEDTEEASLLDIPATEAETGSSIQFYCVGCGKQLQVKARYAGWSTRCDGCGTVTQVPGQRAEPTAEPNTADKEGATLTSDVDRAPALQTVTDHLDEWSNDPLELATSRSTAAAASVLPRRRGRFFRRTFRGVHLGAGPLGNLLDYIGRTVARMLTPKLALVALVGLLVVGALAANWDRFILITHLDELFAAEAVSDPVRILQRMANLEQELLDLDRRITDVPSAQRAAPQRAEIAFQMSKLGSRFGELQDTRLSTAQREEVGRLAERGERRYKRIRREAARLQRIPGVTEVLAASMRQRGLALGPLDPWSQPDATRLLETSAPNLRDDATETNPAFQAE